VVNCIYVFKENDKTFKFDRHLISISLPCVINLIGPFHEDITKLMDILKNNLFPAHLIEKFINRYITGTQSNHCPRGSLPTTLPTFYFKPPYIGHFSAITQKKIRHFVKRYCNDLDIKLVFSSFKIGNMFGVKDPVPGGLRSRVVY